MSAGPSSVSRQHTVPASVHNADVAEAFEEIGDLLSIQGENPFRIRAYRRAARIVRSLPRDLADNSDDHTAGVDDREAAYPVPDHEADRIFYGHIRRRGDQLALHDV